MAVGVGILYDFPILYFVLLAISTLALSTSEQKSDSSLAKYPLWSFELKEYVLLFPLPSYEDGSPLFR